MLKLLELIFFKVDLKSADRIYTYLFPKATNLFLLPKLRKELKPDSKVVSCDFVFSEKEAVSILSTQGHKLYSYKF